MYDVGKKCRIIGCQLTGFDHDGVSGDQGRRRFAGNEEEGEIPRQYSGSDADRFFEQEDIFVGAVTVDDLTFIATRPLRHVVEVVGGEHHFGLRQPLGFSTLSHNGCRQFRLTLADGGGNFVQPDAALYCRQRFPSRLSHFCGADGKAGILTTALGNTGQQRLRGRIDHFNPPVTLMGNKFAINVMLMMCCH